MVETLDGILDGKMSRRNFLKLCGIAVATALLGCSGKSGSSSSSESFAPAPSLGGHPELEHPPWVKPVPRDIIPKIEEIGKQYIDVYAPVEKVLAFFVERNGKRIVVYPWEIREGDIIIGEGPGPSTEDLNTLSRSELEEIGKKSSLVLCYYWRCRCSAKVYKRNRAYFI